MKTNRKTLKKKNIFNIRDDELRSEITKLCVELQAIKNIWTEQWFEEIGNKAAYPLNLDDEHLDGLDIAFNIAHSLLQEKIEKKLKAQYHLRYNAFAEERDEKSIPFDQKHYERLERLGLQF